MPELLLVRHCQSAGQEPDAPLTQEGRRQAERLAASLGAQPIDRVVSSPFRRARETIEPFSKARGLVPRLAPRLSERRIADPPVSDWRDHVRASFCEPDGRAPGGESGREVLERAWAAIREELDAPARLPVLVTHGHLLALVLHSLDGGFGFEDWERLENPAVFRLCEPHDGAGIRFERMFDA